MAASGATNTEAMVFGGSPRQSAVELFNGSSWTATTNMNVAVSSNTGCGTDTATLAFQGISPSTPSGSTFTEQWLSGGGTIVTNIETV
jgi:hypothetical protein